MQLFIALAVLLLTIPTVDAKPDCSWMTEGRKKLSIQDVRLCNEEINMLALKDAAQLAVWMVDTQSFESLKKFFEASRYSVNELNNAALMDFTFLAITSESPVKLIKFLEEIGIETVNVRLGSKSVVYHTIDNDHEELFDYFLSKPEYKSLILDDANILAASKSGNIDMFDKLAALGLDIKTQDAERCNALDHMTFREHTEMISHVSERYGMKELSCFPLE